MAHELLFCLIERSTGGPMKKKKNITTKKVKTIEDAPAPGEEQAP